MTQGGEHHEAPAGEDAETHGDEAALVARLRAEIEAARRRMQEEWARYQQRAREGPTREAIVASPILPALLGLVS